MSFAVTLEELQAGHLVRYDRRRHQFDNDAGSAVVLIVMMSMTDVVFGVVQYRQRPFVHSHLGIGLSGMLLLRLEEWRLLENITKRLRVERAIRSCVRCYRARVVLHRQLRGYIYRARHRWYAPGGTLAPKEFRKVIRYN